MFTHPADIRGGALEFCPWCQRCRQRRRSAGRHCRLPVLGKGAVSEIGPDSALGDDGGRIGIFSGWPCSGPADPHRRSEITELDQTRAFFIAMSATITVIIASQLGLPVSSTHIAVGGVFGVGFLREYLKWSYARMVDDILRPRSSGWRCRADQGLPAPLRPGDAAGKGRHARPVRVKPRNVPRPNCCHARIERACARFYRGVHQARPPSQDHCGLADYRAGIGLAGCAVLLCLARCNAALIAGFRRASWRQEKAERGRRHKQEAVGWRMFHEQQTGNLID